MDHHERSIARARAQWRAKRAGKTSSSLWGFENWANEGTEAHHAARKKYGDQLIDVPISMHRELTRRQMEEHPPDELEPKTHWNDRDGWHHDLQHRVSDGRFYRRRNRHPARTTCAVPQPHPHKCGGYRSLTFALAAPLAPLTASWQI